MPLEPIEPLLELFAALEQVIEETRHTLALVLLHSDQAPSPAVQARLDAALEHLAEVREGFVVTLRTSSVRDPSELRALVRHILLNWNRIEDLARAWERGEQHVERPVPQMLAFGHAFVALGCLPRLPPGLITFPQPRPSYADIPVPGTPGEWLARIEELEAVITQIGEQPTSSVARDRLRRTVGYFDASAWLVAQHSRRWGRPGSAD